MILEKKCNRKEISSKLILNQTYKSRNIRELFEFDKEITLSKESNSSQISTDNE